MSDIERYKNRSLIKTTEGEKALVPEGLDSVKLVMDQAQITLEQAYGLEDLGLLKASGFIYPGVSSQMAEHNLAVDDWANSGFFVTDADSEEGIRQEVRRELLKKQAFRESLGLQRNPYIDQNLGITPQNPNALLPASRFNLQLPMLLGRIREGIFRSPKDNAKTRQSQFKGLHPVIYISPEIIAETKGVSDFAEMLSAKSFRALDVVTEEMGHFLYAQVQYLLNGKVPGKIISEGMALIDNYQIIKKACEKTGQNIFDANNPFIKEMITKYIEKISGRGQLMYQLMDQGDYHPTASNYTKSVEVMGGFIKHIILIDRQDGDTASELQSFYRMTGPQKGRYLRSLYTEYVQGGDNSYKEPLLNVKNRMQFEYEFEDEELWREKWEAVKDHPLAHFIVDPF